MNEPVVFVENYYNRLAFPGHVITPSAEQFGYEAYHVATGRRGVTNAWRGAAANTAVDLGVLCNRLRAANMLAIDRNSNIRGATIGLYCSNDGGTTQRNVWTGTVPTSVTSPGDLDNTNGVLTEEGAFLVRFPTDAYTTWSLHVPALGAGIVPVLGGVYLGMSLQLDYLGRPYGENQSEIMREEVTIPATGWTGGTPSIARKSGQLIIKLVDDWSYELCRLHLEGHFQQRNRPMWIIPNRNQAERAVLAVRQPGQQGFTIEQGWGYRQGVINYREHEPRTNVASVA